MSEPKIRFNYLDGLRGLAAFYVFLNHLYTEINWRLGGSKLPPPLQIAMQCLAYGRFSVGIFIVLSGYCLMLPIVRSANHQISPCWLSYFKRRARRILPPYYAAMLLSLLLFAIVPARLNPTMGHHWNNVQPAFTPGVLLSHLLLVHNLREEWIYKINGPMWSVATEWQIYFFFPLLLLLWRRFGVIFLVVTAFAVGLAPHYLLAQSLDSAFPWYLGLFALGMAGAVIGFSKQPSLVFWREKIPWNLLCLGLIVVLALHQNLWLDDHAWIVDAIVGAIAACFLIYCTRTMTRTSNRERPLLILQLLNLPSIIALGSFSYSLYLVHAPVLGLAHLLANSLPVSPRVQLLALAIVAVPLGLLLSYLFHLAFERRFMHSHSRKEAVVR